MEGLPYHGDDLRYLCSKGLYPDAAVVLEVHVLHTNERTCKFISLSFSPD